MKRLLVLALLILAVTLGTMMVSAQQEQRIVYQTAGFANVAGNNTAAYIDSRKNILSKIIQERMKTEQILGWAVYQVVYRGMPASEFNFVTVTTFSGPPTQGAQGVAEKATGMSAAELGAKLGPLATNVGNMLFRAEGGTGPLSLQEGNIVNTVSWKIAPQRGADYGRYIQTMQIPLNTQAVKDGRILGWVASRVVSPGGPDAPFNALTATVSKDLASTLPATPPGPNQGQMAFAKVFPNQNFSAFVDQGRAVRQAVRTQMLRVVATVNRPAGAGSR